MSKRPFFGKMGYDSRNSRHVTSCFKSTPRPNATHHHVRKAAGDNRKLFRGK
jgi:hypothetical protein